jgi:hypothetical protein
VADMTQNVGLCREYSIENCYKMKYVIVIIQNMITI